MATLEAIVDQPQSVGLPDLADRLGMSRQALHRVLQQLQDHGLVVKIPNRDRFAIGSRFSKIALQAICSANQGAPVRAIVQQAVAGIGETCNIGVLAGREYIYIERVECERYPRIYLETGSRLPPHVTSGGKAMLAHMPDRIRDSIVETLELRRYTQFTITEKRKLLEELEYTRDRGFAIAWQEFSEGIVGLGVPILGRDGYAMAALALHAPIQRVNRENAGKYATKLQKAARRLAAVWDMST